MTKNAKYKAAINNHLGFLMLDIELKIGSTVSVMGRFSMECD